MSDDPRIHRHASEFGEWEALNRDPHPLLAPYIRRMSGWWERTSFTRRREVPHANTVLIINLGNRLNVSEPGTPHRLNSYHAFFAGLHTSWVVTESTGGIGGGIQVDLTPLGAYLVTGIPSSELANRVVHLDDVLGRRTADLVERLESMADWAERFDLVEQVLAVRIARGPRASEGVAWAWARLEAENGLIPIACLTDELGWSPRQLIDAFRREIGLPPKQLARVLRFNRAVKMLTPDGAPALAAIAHECGYYDQAHFSREFREFAGCTPSQHWQRLVPESGGVLDEDPGVPAPEANSSKTALVVPA